MAVNSNSEFVIVQNSSTAFGFPHLYSAIAFIERQVIESDKKVKIVSDLLDGGLEFEGHDYNLYSYEDYSDLFEDESNEDDE